MRLGLVIYGSLDTLSGGYLYDRQLVQTLTAAGDSVDVISLPWRSYAAHLRDNFNSAVRRRMEGSQVDLLLQDELNHPSLFWLNRRLRQRIPIVSIVHHLRASESHPAWLMPLYRRVERAYLRSVAGYIYNGRVTQETVESLAGPGRPGVVAPPAANHIGEPLPPSTVTRRARERGPLRLLFVGNLIPRKGLHTLLRAIAALPPGRVLLSVVGSEAVDRIYARKIWALASRLELGDRVRFLGRAATPEVRRYLLEHHALAVPSSYEGFGIVYLEGFACGLPAIASTQGGAREVVTDGQTGFLVPPEDPAALAEAIDRLANNRRRLGEMGLAALERYAAHPTWEQSGLLARQFLLNQVGSPGAPAS